MEFIKNVRIKNFKSICNIEFEAKRINVLVGKPNAGKSNILEALTFYSSFFSEENKFKEVLRFNDIYDLTHFGEIDKIIGIELDNNSMYFRPNKSNKGFSLLFCPESYFQIESFDSLLVLIRKLELKNNRSYYFYAESPETIRGQLNVIHNTISINPYIFKWPFKFEQSHNYSLESPFGSNLTNAIVGNKELLTIAKELFSDYDLNLVIEKNTNNIEIQRAEGNLIFKIPFNHVSDTLVRLLFFQAAILTNTDKVILFEEPEAHAFPPYMLQMTHSLINSQTNQFFVATHSSYIINELIQKADPKDIAVHVVYYKENSTHIHTLTQPEIDDYLDNGVDILMGMDAYEISE